MAGARPFDAAIRARLSDPFIKAVHLAHIVFDDGDVRLHDDLGELSFRSNDSLAYDFSNSANSFTATNGTLTNHTDFVTFLSTNTANFIESPASLTIDGTNLQLVRARVRRTTSVGTWVGVVRYTTSGGGHGASYSASYQKTIPDSTVLNEWVILEWDMAALDASGGTDWTANTVSRLAFILDNATAKSFDIDWIDVSPRFLGVGDLGSVDGLEERDDGSPAGITLRLNALNQALLDEVLLENFFHREVTVYFGLRDTASGVMIANAFELFHGYIDDISVSAGQQPSIAVMVETELQAWDRPLNRYFSDSENQRLYPGALGAKYMAAMANKRVTLGNKTVVNVSDTLKKQSTQ